MDSAGVQALNLFSNASTMSKNDSILGIFDKCRTPHGHRLVAFLIIKVILSNNFIKKKNPHIKMIICRLLVQWIRQPLRDLNEINERLDIVETLVTNTDIRQQLYDQHLRTIPDLQALMRKIQRKRANLQDCYR